LDAESNSFFSSFPSPGDGPPPKEERAVVIQRRPHYPNAKAWADAVATAGGRIVKADDGSCTLWLHPDLPSERAAPLQDDAEFWLVEVCGEYLTEADFVAELQGMP
jgi:hypothetical protein